MPVMQENMPTPPLEEDTWRLDRIPVAWLGNVLAALALWALMAQVIQDGRREKPPAPATMPANEPASAVQVQMAPTDLRMDINTASREEVESLPGIGEVLARDIIARRPFASVEALNDVPGIGPKRLARLVPLIKAAQGPAPQ